jgi:transcriptional regulator GlxA family with amidase domain
MKQLEAQRTLKVAVLMVDTFAPITILGPLDMLNAACEIWRSVRGDGIRGTTFQTELVSFEKKPLRFGRRVTLYPDASIDNAKTPDLIVIPPPGLGDNIIASLKVSRGFIPWIKACSSRGTRIVSLCTGSFFMMREMDEVESKEICATLSISESNLWVMLHRARMALRECLAVNWFENPEVRY